MTCPKINNQTDLDLTGHVPMFDSFFPYSQKTLGYADYPAVNFISDQENAAKPLGNTGYYDPSSKEITIYGNRPIKFNFFFRTPTPDATAAGWDERIVKIRTYVKKVTNDKWGSLLCEIDFEKGFKYKLVSQILSNVSSWQTIISPSLVILTSHSIISTSS